LPGHYLLQRLPFGRFVGAVIFSWSVIIFLHCVATNYAGLVIVRILLGAGEAVIVPAIEITIGMFFYTQRTIIPSAYLLDYLPSSAYRCRIYIIWPTLEYRFYLALETFHDHHRWTHVLSLDLDLVLLSKQSKRGSIFDLGRKSPCYSTGA
jgi:hypothetical protein